MSAAKLDTIRTHQRCKNPSKNDKVRGQSEEGKRGQTCLKLAKHLPYLPPLSFHSSAAHPSFRPWAPRALSPVTTQYSIKYLFLQQNVLLFSYQPTNQGKMVRLNVLVQSIAATQVASLALRRSTSRDVIPRTCQPDVPLLKVKNTRRRSLSAIRFLSNSGEFNLEDKQMLPLQNTGVQQEAGSALRGGVVA